MFGGRKLYCDVAILFLTIDGIPRQEILTNSGVGHACSGTDFPEISPSVTDFVEISSDWNCLMFVWKQKALLRHSDVVLTLPRQEFLTNSGLGHAHSGTDLSRN